MKKDKYFLIDFEITSPKYEDSEKQTLIHKINKLNFNEKYNSKDYISKKRKKLRKKLRKKIKLKNINKCLLNMILQNIIQIT